MEDFKRAKAPNHKRNAKQVSVIFSIMLVMVVVLVIGSNYI